MDRLQFLLCKLAEEATEVAQAALKAQQFGLGDVGPGQSDTNAERLCSELDDFNAAVFMLSNDTYFQYFKDVQRIAKKVKKVAKYHKLSVSLGMVRE